LTIQTDQISFAVRTKLFNYMCSQNNDAFLGQSVTKEQTVWREFYRWKWTNII